MATSEVIINTVYLLLFITFSGMQLTLTATSITNINEKFVIPTKPRRLVAKLLHHDSLFYNPNNTIEHLAERILHTSINRFTYLSQSLSDDPNIRVNLHPTSVYDIIGFYVSFSLGEPSVPQLNVMDTGSDLIWVDCVTEKGYKYHESSTFHGLPCNDLYCNNNCSKSPDRCTYEARYVGEGLHSSGVLASEKFTFNLANGDFFAPVGIVFGCSEETHMFDSANVTGVFGLSAHRPQFSLVTTLGSQFSYCVGNLFDSDYRYNRLLLGEGAIVDGDSTPLVIQGYYYIIFEGISIGEKLLDIDLDDFKKTSRGNSEVIIDTGTPLTWLLNSVYETLQKEIANLAKEFELIRVHDFAKERRLCYRGEVKDVVGFPVMTLHFADGANLDLDTSSIFYQTKPRTFCLAFASSNDRSILGMIAQQNYSVSYDLGEKRLHFRRIDCYILDDYD